MRTKATLNRMACVPLILMCVRVLATSPAAAAATAASSLLSPPHHSAPIHRSLRDDRSGGV